jgi:hypothetical protein
MMETTETTMRLTDVIRQARKEYRTSMDKITAIKLVRKLTGRGLKEAKDFFDWIDANGDGLSAPKLAGHWCEKHWQDNEICGCPEGVEVVADEQALTAGAGASGGEPVSPNRRAMSTALPAPVPVLSESDFASSGLPMIAAMIRLNVKCGCGVPNCKNNYHALATYLNKTPGAWELWYAALDKYIEQQQQ